MPLDEDAFQARIMARAAELGLNEAEVMRRAGRAADTFNKRPGESGRTYNLIESIAGAVGMTVAEAIGQAAPMGLLLRHAVKVACRAIPSDRRELLADAIESAYDVLFERHHAGLPIDESALSTLEAMIRRNIGRPA
jgi:hypothetical protein